MWISFGKKKVFIYAMAPLALRCLEQHKTATCLMNLNVCSIVTGIGLSYANSGPVTIHRGFCKLKIIT